MYAVVRRYKDKALMDTLLQAREDVTRVIKGTPGFVAYYLIKSADGGASLTVCNDQAGAAESTRRASEWILQNAPAHAAVAPDVTEGEVGLQFAG